MVFEAVVVDLLNKFLNQYIENLDTSQLKIGIWGGDVVLADLIVKQTIFKEWNLPFKVAYGKLGKLSLRIPWKNLYGEATSAVVENLFILFVPNTEMEYDAQKEEKWAQEKKQLQLKMIDEAKKRELEKGNKCKTNNSFSLELLQNCRHPNYLLSRLSSVKILCRKGINHYPNYYPHEVRETRYLVYSLNDEISRHPPQGKVETPDTFMEKLMMQIVKTIQVEIKNIHIRYEDKTTDPQSPFSIGATISNLSLQSTAKDPFPLEFQKTGKMIDFVFKTIQLEGLSIYWNPEAELLAPLKPAELQEILLANIPRPDFKPEGYKYVFGPIIAKGSLRLNPKPESDGTNFATPKVFILVDMEEIKLAVSRKQYRSISLFLQNLQRLSTASRYRKYKPFGLSVVGHTKEWWHFAYDAVTEDIKRRKIEWSWDHIKKHREMCRKYEELFRTKAKTKKPPKHLDKELEDLEKRLNIFDLVLLREKVYVEVERQLIAESESKVSSGWFSYFFSYGSAKTDGSEKDDIVTKLEKAMTPKEKEKLYKAIDYQENYITAIYPDYFIEFKFLFKLKALRLRIYDDKKQVDKSPTVLSASLRDVKLLFEKRTSANAMKLVVNLGDFSVLGQMLPGEEVPEIVRSNCKKNEQLVDVLLETNPLDGACDQRIHVNANALFIIYHAHTVNILRDIFNPYTEEKVTTIVTATAASLPTFQEMTSMGLQYAISKSSRLEVRVHILASNLIIPYDGVYHPDKEFLIIKLGQFDVTTEERTGRDISVRKLHLQGSSEKDIFSIFLSASYRKFKCQLMGVQILYRLPGEEWAGVLESKEQSPLRLLEPTNLTIIIKKCLVTDDARIPKAVVEGNLPGITINISEDRVICLAGLVSSIPTSSPDPEVVVMNKRLSSSAWSLQSFGTQIETKLRQKVHKKEKVVTDENFVQGIDLVARFEMNEFIVVVSKTKMPPQTGTSTMKSILRTAKNTALAGAEEKFLELSVLSLNCELTCKTFETLAELKLGAIEVKQNHMGTFIPMVQTKGAEGEDYYLFLAEYVNVDKKIPDFFNKRGGVVTTLKLNFTTLDILLHKEAIIDHIAFLTLLQNRLQEVKVNQASKMGESMTKKMASIFEDGIEATFSEKKIVSKGKKFRKKKQAPDVVDLVVDVNMDSLNVKVTSDLRELSSLSVEGGKIEFSSRKSYMNIDCKLHDVLVLDMNPHTKHKKIVSSMDRHTLSLKATIFNAEFLETSKSVDISFEAEIGRVRLVFLSSFINTALGFLNTFQNETAVIREGASAAAQKAKEGVIKAYENETKICLSVKIMAPLIVFPRKSGSLDVLLMDMGILTVKSFITELEDTSSANTDPVNTPLMDVIRCHLENVKLTRAVLSADTEAPVKETSILDPVTLEITLNRNLSISWYKDMVPLQVQGRLELIHVSLTHSDLCFIVHALKDNFAEGYTEVSKDKDASFVEIEDEESKIVTTSQKCFGEEDKSLDPKIQPSIVFSFLTDRFIFDNVDDCEMANREEAVSNLARFVLEVFSVKGTIFSDGSMSTSAFLSNVTMNDTRPGKEGRITNLMDKKTDLSYQTDQTDANSTVPAMLNIGYQKKDIDSFVDIRVYGFNLILSMDFISKLLSFFTIDDPVSAQPPIQIQTKQTEVRRTGSAIKPAKIAAQGRKSKEKKDDTEVGPLPTFTVNVRLEKPDIIIVENMDSPDTDALIFNTELLMKYRCAGSRQVITGTLSDIGLVSCCFNTIKRSQTLSQIIKPFTISMAGSTPEGQGLHVDICLTDIHLSINAKAVELITKCHKTLFSDCTRDESKEEPVDYSDLWKIKTFHDDDYWFLRTEEGVDALLTLSRQSSQRATKKKFLEEICLLSVPAVVITIEGISGKSRLPLILFEMSAQGQILNWSSQLTIDCLIKIQMQYFNKSLSAWEPLIEPTEVIRDKKSFFTPWELDCNIVFGNGNEIEATDAEEETSSAPSLTATLSCSQNLEITITKSCLEVLQNLADAFSTAVTQCQTKTIVYPPYIVKNETGVLIELLLENSHLELYGKRKKEGYKIVRLESGGEIELQEDKKYNKLSGNAKKVFIGEKKELYLHIKSPVIGSDVLELPISRTVKRYYPIKNPSTSRDKWGLISDVNISQNSDVITLRSVLQLKNYFQEAIDVHYAPHKSKELEYIGTVEGNSVLNLPFHSVYSSKNELYFSVQGFSVSSSPLSWRDIKNEISTTVLLRCDPDNSEDTDPFFIMAVGEIENVYFENSYRHTISSMCINIHLQPTLEFINCLPVDLVVCSQGCATEKSLSSAERLQITHAEPGFSTIALRIHDYLEKEWSCKETIPIQPAEFSVWTFTSYNGLAPEKMNVGVFHSTKRSSSILTIYCPYLMVNQTGHLLSYRFDDNSSTIYHPPNHKKPLMFSPGAKKFFGKKKALMKVNQGEWSDKFPVDVAGSGGTIECYDPVSNCRYLIAVTITLTFNNLSKIVLLSPYYVLLNKTMYRVQCQEVLTAEEPWITIEPGECVPFWPLSEEKRKTVHLRLYGTKETTPPFCYDSTDSVLLTLKNKCGGLLVDIQTTNAGTNIIIYPYEPGLAPALILNHTQEILRFVEKGTESALILKPRQMSLYSWAVPTQERKLLFYGEKNKEYGFNLKEDIDGKISFGKNEVKYVSFLDGFQRILLFTEDTEAASDARLAGHFENTGMEVNLKIHGIGISLVNNISQIEILYMGFVSSGISWETKKESRSRYKPMSSKDSYAVENAFQKYEENRNIDGGTDSVVVIDNKLQVNFDSMEMLYPHKRKIRRVFEPGLWSVYRATENYITLHVKINKIQIDNQLHDSIFPVVLCPVPPPKTVAVSQGPKPFFELSVLKVSAGQSRVQQYKYFRILVQEFNVKIDMGFITQCWALLTADEVTDEEYKAKFKKDMARCEEPLLSYVTVLSTTEQKNFYDLLHFSPLKIHFSFSLAGNVESSLMPPALSVLLQSLGVTLTDLHDVLFRLSYFERKSAFLTYGQLRNEVVRHYYGQAIRQAYVLILGLDVIGNPFGLVIGIGQGVEAFFYEPVQGIIQGPSDFATGVALGCRSLFGHTVGGTAGTLGRITGTLGKGLAVLSLDKEYQRERMEQQNRRTDNISASMAQGGRGVVMGVYEGVTGVVMKPISGAKEEGVGGFFKGVGKGMMGLVTRPVTGVVDFASTSLNAVKRAAELNVECKRLRPPRFFQDDRLVLPYKKHEALGNSILFDIEKRKYCKTDKYEYHAELRGKEILLLTDKRMLLTELSDVFGNWQVHLDIAWLEMSSPPKEHPKGVSISVPKKKSGLFQSHKDVKVLVVDDAVVKEILFTKMVELYYLETRSSA